MTEGPHWSVEGLANRINNGEQIIGVRDQHIAVLRMPDDVPSTRWSEPPGVLGAQVIGVRLCEGGEGADHDGSIGIGIGEGRDGRLTARRLCAATR